MRHITAIVDLNGKVEVTTQLIGYSGEHNAVSLEVGFTEEGLSLYSKADYFRIVIDGFYSEKLFLSQNNVVQCNLPQDVMKPPKINCQLLGYKGDESEINLILKSGVFSFQVDCSEVPFQKVDDGADCFEEALHICTAAAENASNFCEDAEKSAKSASNSADLAIANSIEASVQASTAAIHAQRAERAAESLANNNLANSLKGNKTSSVVLLNDVSPIEHTVKVQFSDADESNTLSVTACGKNLLPYPYVDTPKSPLVKNGVTFTDNGDGSVTVKGTAEGGGTVFILSYHINFGDKTIDAIYKDSATNGEYAIGKRMYYNAWSEYLPVSINIPKGVTVDETLYPQIELGTVSTEYEPYVKPETYTAQADGSLTVPSIYPTMMLSAESNTTNLLTGNVLSKPNSWFSSSDGITVPGYDEVYLSSNNYYRPLILEGSHLEAGKEYIFSVEVLSFVLNHLSEEKLKPYAVCLQYNNYESDKIQLNALGKLELTFKPTVSGKYNLICFGRDDDTGSVSFTNPQVKLVSKIECEYNRDLNKAFAELQQAIISLGGNL